MPAIIWSRIFSPPDRYIKADGSDMKNYNSACSLVVQLHYTNKKKNVDGLGKVGYQTCVIRSEWWNMPKSFSGITTHYNSSSVWRTA